MMTNNTILLPPEYENIEIGLPPPAYVDIILQPDLEQRRIILQRRIPIEKKISDDYIRFWILVIVLIVCMLMVCFIFFIIPK